MFLQAGEGIRSMRGLRAVTDAEKRSRRIGAKCVAMESLEFVDLYTVSRAYWFNISSNNFNNPGKCNI